MPLRAFVTVLVMSMCAACGSTPTAPAPNELTSILIEPALVEIGVGTTTQLSARGVFSDGSSSSVAVTWAVTPNDVASVSASGALLGLRLGIATVSAGHDSGLSAAARIEVIRNPAVPLPPDTNLSGTWEGLYVVDACKRISGDGPSVCRFVLGTNEPIRLEITETNGRLQGTLTLYSNVRGSVHGWRDASTNHVLFGRLTGEEETEGLTFELTQWMASAVDNSEITGSFEGLERFTAPATGPQVYLRGGTFSGFRRVSGGTR